MPRKNSPKRTAADQAEFAQAVTAYLIPSSLFVSCLLCAAATFLVTNHEPLGWGLYGLMLAIMIWAFTAFIRFQNKLRARGQFRGEAARTE